MLVRGSGGGRGGGVGLGVEASNAGVPLQVAILPGKHMPAAATAARLEPSIEHKVEQQELSLLTLQAMLETPIKITPVSQ